jgi:hypothetical protein
MKKLCIGLLGILACATGVRADGFSESDGSLIGAKDSPFPPDESVLPENASPSDSNSSNGEDQSSNPDNPQQEDENTEKENGPEVDNYDNT